MKREFPEGLKPGSPRPYHGAAKAAPFQSVKFLSIQRASVRYL
jgi:hypothetical protein